MEPAFMGKSERAVDSRHRAVEAEWQPQRGGSTARISGRVACSSR